MRNFVINRNILTLAVIFAIYGMAVNGYADEKLTPHFHHSTTTRSVNENVPIGTSVGSVVSGHSMKSRDRYILTGTDAGSFTINEESGQLATNVIVDYESQKTYTVIVTIQIPKKIVTFPSGETLVTEYRDMDSITVTINVIDQVETHGTSSVDALPAFTSAERKRIISLISLNSVIFNEIYNASDDTHDWLELRNVTDTEVDLSGWRLIISTDAQNISIAFPAGTHLPAGELMLLVNTDPEAPNMPLASVNNALYRYLVDEVFRLPKEDFMLLLRSPNAWEDNAGRYLFGHDKPPMTADFTLDTAWMRTKPDIPGHQAEAWMPSGYQAGLGYDADAPAATNLGTPGHRRELPSDVNGDGIVNILDLVWVASKFGAAGETGGDLNGDGTVDIQDLILVANSLGNVATAPSAKGLRASQVEEWLRLGKQGVLRLSVQTPLYEGAFSYKHGIQVLEDILQVLRPKRTALFANYPNPFNPETWIPYQLATAGDVKLSIYDGRGSLVRQFMIGHQSAGVYQSRNRAVYWDGKNALGESVASGIYFYTLTTADFSATRKMLILK